jgi:Gas vesicle synthesis protein GvpL/GvpF
VTYVYAIAERFPAAVEGMRGVGELPVRPLAAAGLAVAVGEAPSPGALADADLWAHELVVEALAAAGPVLPARFGSRLPDDAAVVAFVSARAGALRSALSRVRGRSELAVRARRLGQGQDQEAATPGAGAPARTGATGSVPSPVGRPGAWTAYLAGLAVHARWAASLRETVHRPLMALAADGCWGTNRSGPWQTTGSYLVETCAVREFATAVASLARRLDGTALTCTGPWPPYSFAAVDR